MCLLMVPINGVCAVWLVQLGESCDDPSMRADARASALALPYNFLQDTSMGVDFRLPMGRRPVG